MRVHIKLSDVESPMGAYDASVCDRRFVNAVVLNSGDPVPDSVTCKTCRKRWEK